MNFDERRKSFFENKVYRLTSKIRRPLSYPCGPETDLILDVEFPGEKVRVLTRSPSDPLKGQLGGKKKLVPLTKECLERAEDKYGYKGCSKRRGSSEDEFRLPGKYEPFPKHLYGLPLEEVDTFIYNKTFCVVSKRFKKNYIHRFTATNSFFVFSPFNSCRKLCIYLSTNQYFDYLVMTTILFNCAFLAMTETIEEAEYIFLGIYTLEMVIKTIAKGFIFNKFSYLRNAWNWLDFIVITSGYTTIGIEGANLAGLRTFRVLRALKPYRYFQVKGLKTIINALLHSFKQLAEVMSLTIFCLMVFALFALQVYKGELRNKCVLKFREENASLDTWLNWTRDPKNWLFHSTNEKPLLCGNVTGSRNCPPTHTCLSVGDNPNYGYTSFDNFFWSMLTTFQIITLDYWENVYNMVLASCGPLSVSFFTLLVFFGSFYLINLMLAVVALSYEEESEITQEERKKELVDHREDSTFSFDPIVLNVKRLTKDKFKTNDARKGILLSYYSRKKNRRRKPIRRMAVVGSQKQDQNERKQKKAVATKSSSSKNIWQPGPGPDDPSSGKSVQIELAPEPRLPIVYKSNKYVPPNDLNYLDTYCIKNDYDSHTADRNCACCKRCCLGYKSWLRFQQMLYHIVKDPLFELAITVCIVLNTIFLAMEHHGMSELVLRALDIGNKVFTSIFIFECCLKIMALNIEFFNCGWNVFDLIIVSASLLDLIFELVDGLSVLRGLRLLRVLKLAQSWITMKVLLSIIISTIGALGNLTLVLVIVIYIFAVIGMQLFAKDYTEDKFFPDPIPRWNFTDFFHSFMMIFRILCGEWIEPLWDCMRAENNESPGICLAVFLPTLVMGNFMVLNLFLALLLNSFNSEELKHRKKEVGHKSQLAQSCDRIRELVRKHRLQAQAKNEKTSCLEQIVWQVMQAYPKKDAIQTGKFPRDNSSYQEAMNRPISIVSNDLPNPNVFLKNHIEIRQSIDNDQPSKNAPNKNQATDLNAKNYLKYESMNFNNDKKSADPQPWQTIVSYVDELTVGGEENSGQFVDEIGNFTAGKKQKIPKVPPGCFPSRFSQRWLCIERISSSKLGVKWTKLRGTILAVVDTSSFEWFILVLIFASSGTLCFEDIYLDDSPELKKILYWTNLAFSIIFVIEMVFKWMSMGFYKYFTSFWTILDFLSFSILIEENESLKMLRSLRTLRALRPLRAISRWQGMRIVVNALIYAIPSIFNVLLVCLVFWLIFSIMGVQFFSGKFYKCLDDEGERLDVNVVNSKWDCKSLNYSWMNSKISFDHVGIAYLALFQVATFEGWMEVISDAVDARGVNLQPKREANLYAYIYFIIFIICGSFFTLNLFIGVIIDNFNMLKKKYEGGVLEMFLTDSQKHYYTAMKKLGRKKPQKVIKRPTNGFLAIFYDLANSRRFEIAIFVLIFLNMLTMGIEHYGQSNDIFFMLEVSNAFFTTIFSLEAIVKILGLRFDYFTVPWNVFDFLLVLASIFGILMEDIGTDLPISPTLLRVVRVFRIGRILRLIKAAKGIRKLLFALVVSLPALFNIGALLALVIFIYAIIGMFLFGHVRQQGALDDLVNFETFGRSMHLLFRLITSAGWNDVLESLMVQYPDCDPHAKGQANGDCGYPLTSIIYLTSFIIINYMILINMYIAVILENFNQAHQEEEIGIVEDDLEMFYIRWSKYDPHATQFIRFSQLSDFVASLDPPLGISKPNVMALVSFNLPIAKGNKIHCLDILHALVKHVLGHVEENDNLRQLKAQMNIKFKKQFPNRKELEIVSSTRIWKRQDKAARVIQKAWKHYVKTKNELAINDPDQTTQNSSPGDWRSRLSTFLHVHRGSRVSSRKSSRASNSSDLSELGGPWLNIPLLLLSGATNITPEALEAKRGDGGSSPHLSIPTDTRESTSILDEKKQGNSTNNRPALIQNLDERQKLQSDQTTSDVCILVTEASPEKTSSKASLNRKESESTLAHVLVHRESEEMS